MRGSISTETLSEATPATSPSIESTCTESTGVAVKPDGSSHTLDVLPVLTSGALTKDERGHVLRISHRSAPGKVEIGKVEIEDVTETDDVTGNPLAIAPAEELGIQHNTLVHSVRYSTVHHKVRRADGTSTTTAPTLDFRLIVSRRRIILGPDEQITASVPDNVIELVGPSDVGAASVFLASEVTPGTPMPGCRSRDPRYCRSVASRSSRCILVRPGSSSPTSWPITGGGVPDSEEVVLANFSTPLAHIPEIAVSFFDATVLVSSFAHA